MQTLREDHRQIDLEKLQDSTHLLDMLLQCENVLDSMDCYVYQNWIDGEVIEGPIVRRHWITIGLLYPFNKMPDPRAALRLLKHGVQVEFDQIKREETGHPGQPNETPKDPTDWFVTLTFPRRLLDQIDGVDMEIYDDEVDPDDVTAAKDIGLDDETPNKADEQLPPGGPEGMPDQTMQPPGPEGAPNAPPRF
jgi:hypothetical protein